MIPLPSDYINRWRTGKYIGPAIPNTTVEYRTGRFVHRYELWNGPPVHAIVGGAMRVGFENGQVFPTEGRRLFWQNFWTPDSGSDGVFTDLPNVLDWSISQNFANNGIHILTLTVENIAYPAVTGPGGVYHSIKRGYYAPKRGYSSPGRLPLSEGGQVVPKNEWYGRFNSGGQIRIWHGYGDSRVPIYTGLIDDIDTQSHPDRITITARDFGQTLTDMRVFGWNKEPRIRDPAIFIDRLRADNTKKVGYNLKASSTHPDHPLSNVSDHDSDTYWLSQGNDSPDHTEWIEAHIPEGRYEDFYVFPRQAGMDVYVSIYAKHRAGKPPTRNNHEIPEGWVDLGHGNVPDTDVPYVRLRRGLNNKGVYMGLGDVYRLGSGSVIRVQFRKLRRRKNGHYYAGCNRFFVLKRSVKRDAITKHWILVDDVADMVRVALRWAGFKEWDVETTGVRLKERFVVPRSMFYMDIIKAAQDQTGYVFFMQAPTENDQSIGIPTFRRPVVVDPRIQPRALVRDTKLLTGVETKETDEPRAYIIRARGRAAKDSEGGVPLSGDRTKRLMYVYRPPWWRRLGGIVKHVVHSNNGYKTTDDVKFACFYIALQEALEADKGTCGFPILPTAELDSHIAVLDVGTGLTTRLWISERELKFQKGEKPQNAMSIGGALVDTADIQAITKLIRETPRGSDF